MDPICLIVAGVVRASIPAAEFTLSWEHSVQKSRWEERYLASASGLVLVEARVQATGAGMEPPPSATWREGWWTWRPQTYIPELRLTRSNYARDYVLCWKERCSELGALIGSADDGAVVVVRPCA